MLCIVSCRTNRFLVCICTLPSTYKYFFRNILQVRVLHLLVKSKDSRRPASWKSPDGITRTKEQALATLKSYRERICMGEVTFEALASTESDCSSAKHGGDLGYFNKGQMQPPFEEAAFALDVGQLSGPVWTDSGVHIIKRIG